MLLPGIECFLNASLSAPNGSKVQLRIASIHHTTEKHATQRIISVYYILYMTHFGQSVRELRERLRRDDPSFSVRQVAQRVGVQPAYLSKVERGDVMPPSEATTIRLAKELGVDEDVLLALAGKVSSDLQEIIRKRPRLFADLIRELKEAPDEAVLRVVREVREGDW